MLPTSFLKPQTLYIMLAAIVLSAIIGFSTGWKVNGWRLGKELAVSQGQVAVLSQGIKTQNKAIEALNVKRLEAEGKRADADKKVAEIHKASETKIKSLREGKPIMNTCEAELQEMADMLERAR